MIGDDLVSVADRLASERSAFVVATVVRAQRPTSVRPGDSALVHADGTIDGFVGGVCAESSVRLHALRAMETGEPVLLRLLPDAPRSDGGGEPGAEADALGAIVEHNPCLSGGSLEIFLEPKLPPPRIVVTGDAPIARAVRQLAAAAGYEVTGDDVPNASAVIVASHGRSEDAMLSEALATGVPYVGLVASARRAAAVRAALDVPDELRAQLHSPAGLDLGARTPAEVAIAILAQVVAEHRSRSGPAARDSFASGPGASGPAGAEGEHEHAHCEHHCH